MRRPPIRLFAAALLSALLLLCAEPSVGRGQQKKAVVVPAQPEEKKASEPAYTDAVTLPRNPEAKRLIQAAEDYIKKKEWRVAGECLQSLLDLPEDSFIEITRKNDRGQELSFKVSVRTEANRIIGELPAEALESYRLQYGPTAEDKLKDAVATADPGLLALVSQRYQHTDAGLKATDLLGTYHLDRGQYLMAALCYERLLARPDADKIPPKILFRAALAFRRAGMPAQAEPLFTRFAEAARRGDVAFGKQKLSLDALRAEYGRDIGQDLVAGLFDWPIFRGNPSRSALGQGGTAYLEPRWTSKLTRPTEPVLPGDQSAVTWLEQHLDTATGLLRDKPILPAFFPIAANGRLLVRAYDGVAAFQLKTSPDGSKRAGDLLWRQPATRSLFHVVREDNNGGRMAFDNWYNGQYRQAGIGPAGIAFEHSVLGAISHDGQRAYFIDDLAIPPHPSMMMAGMFGGASMNMAPFNEIVDHSLLAAIDLESGKLVWAPLGGASAEKPGEKSAPASNGPPSAATELLNSYFLGPPLPLGGKLYLLTEKNTELRLVCLDPNRLVPSPINPIDRCPELVWVQSLGTAHTKIKADGLRRTHVAHLAYSDGILVCPTNAGAVLGVDLLSHSLVWAFSYRKVQQQPENDELRFRRFNRFPTTQSASAGERWRPSAPCIVGGKVVFTAPDGSDSDIHCLRLRDGQPVWNTKRDATNDLYLAGVFDDKVVIVAKNHVRALSLESGKEVWRQAATGMPAGQGAASEGIYYLPLATSADLKSADRGPEICAIVLKTGAVAGRSKARGEAPGNLLFLEGELVSQSVRTVASFPQLKVKQDEIERALAKNPDDPTGLAGRGELFLYNGAVKDAIADLRHSLSRQPPPEVRDRARTKLHEAMTVLLQRDFTAGEQYLAEYEQLCQIEIPTKVDGEARNKLMSEKVRRQATYLELLGRGREKQGRLLEAFTAYEKYGELAGHRELVESVDEPNVRARPDIWSRGRIQALITAANPTDRAKLEAEINQRWERVRATTKLDELRAFVTLYGPISTAGQSARIALAERLIATGEPDDVAEAERTLGSLCFSAAQRRDDPSAAVRASEMMISLCVRRGQFENAVGFYRQLADEFPDRVIRDGKSGRQLFEELQLDKRFIPYLDSPTAVWTGELSGKRVSGNFQVRESTLSIQPEGELSPFYDRHRLVLDMRADSGTGQANWSIRVLDRATGEERWRIPGLPTANYLVNNQMNAPFAFACGQQLVVHLNQKVIALDLVEKRELWSYNLLGKDPIPNLQGPNFGYEPASGVFLVQQEDERKVALGRVAVFEPGYVAVLTRNGLVAIDPTRPGASVLWQKADVGTRCQVFGDDKHVFVIDRAASEGSKVQVLRAADGQPVSGHHFSAEFFQKKLRVYGGRLLVAEPRGAAVRLIDAFSGKEVWRRDFTAPAIVMKSEDPRLLGVIEPSGLFTLLDPRTGEVELTSRLLTDRVDRLVDASLFADRDRFYLALNRKEEKGMNWRSAAVFSLRSTRVNGPVIALNRRTGKREWECPFLPHQSMITEQWADLPVLVFAADFDRTGESGRPEYQGVRVSAVSKTTGKLVFDDEKLVRHGQFHALQANATAGRVELVRQDVKVVLATADAAARPEPAAPPARPGSARIRAVPAAIAPPPPVRQE